ncbi:MAG: M14 family zinc carboxypeptidase [Actinomycetota bacterium]
MRRRSRALVITFVLVGGTLPLALAPSPVTAIPNPVATDIATYTAYGRVFPDPQGCLSADIDGDDVNDVVAPNTSPWAKGNVCVGQFIQYEEFIEGTKFLQSLFPRFVELIRLDEAYDNPNYRSAGLGRMVTIEDGQVKVIGRDRRPLYMVKVTDKESPIPEAERLHFVYSGSIHGIERAGAEAMIRAAEDLASWAANLPDKPLIETETDLPVPTAGETLERSVVYFTYPNPDGWGRGQFAPVEFRDGSLNPNYTPSPSFHRYNGNGMDLNRDFPTVGYTYRPYTSGSEPETQAFTEVLRGIRSELSPKNPVGQRFAGGIDMHGQLNAPAFSFTLTGAGQRDFRKNFATVDQGLRTWSDQTTRLSWSPYIGTVFEVADEWGTVIDTIGYQVTGSHGDWFESETVGLGAVGIDNEMSLSHLAPNSVYEPALEQMHVDGNKGLMYSQIASTLTEKKNTYAYKPSGKTGYVFNPKRIVVKGNRRTKNPGLPAQNDIDVLVPCQSAGPQNNDVLLSCDEPGVAFDPQAFAVEFDVKGPSQGFWNGGITVTMTNVNVLSISHGTLARIALDRMNEDGQWEEVQQSFVQAGSPDLYVPAGQLVAVNDPIPGRWRARITNPAVGPSRLQIDFKRNTGEMSPGQTPINASSMDFFTELNTYIKSKKDYVEAIPIDQIVKSPSSLKKFDSIVVTNNVGNPAYLKDKAEGLGLPASVIKRYFAGLKSFAAGGGNLVLTDAALQALPELGLAKKADVAGSFALAGRYEFGDSCNTTPLTRKVCLPGTAGGTSRQAVEPTPLGYSPDHGFDVDPARVMPTWLVNPAGWTKSCGDKCVEATILDGAGLGRKPLGKGVVGIAGIMFPDPNYAPDGPADMRFGLADYSLTFSAWQIFLNLVDYRR